MFSIISFYTSSALAQCSWFYGFSVLISIIAVVASLTIKYRINNAQDEHSKNAENMDIGIRRDGIQARYKHLRQKYMEEKLTPQQLDTEKNVEIEALNTIMDLLQKRRDIFPTPTMDELKEQLKLYRSHSCSS